MARNELETLNHQKSRSYLWEEKLELRCLPFNTEYEIILPIRLINVDHTNLLSN